MPKEAAHLDEEDARRLLELLQNEPDKYRAAISFDLLSGLRRGELLGLRWSDVDFENETVTIVFFFYYFVVGFFLIFKFNIMNEENGFCKMFFYFYQIARVASFSHSFSSSFKYGEIFSYTCAW